MTDSLQLLVDANDFETSGNAHKAIELCETALDGTEYPDHYLTLARNYFKLAHAGNEVYAWRALWAAVEGIDRRAKQFQQADVEFAVGIVKWVLEHFSDWNRVDVSTSYLQAQTSDEVRGAESGASMAEFSRKCLSMLEANDAMILANALYRESPLIVRPGRSQESVEREARFALANQFSQQQDSDAGKYLSGLGLPVPGGFNFQLYEKYLHTASKVELLRLKARARGVPTILLTCLPKSASEFFAYTLAETLNAPIVRGTIGDPLRGVIVEEWLREILQGGCVLHDHFGARRENISALRSVNVTKIIVLVRDPRAVAFSLRNMSDELGVSAAVESLVPVPVPEKDTIYPYFVRTVELLADWINSWIVARMQGLNVEFVRFGELVSDPENVMGMVLDQFGADKFKTTLCTVLASKGKGSNFRKGDDNAWRQSIPNARADEAWAVIPPSVKNLLALDA